MYRLLVGFIFFCFVFDAIHAQGTSVHEEGVQSKFRSGIGWFYKGLGVSGESSDRLNKFDRFVIDIVYNDWRGDIPAFKGPWSNIGINGAWMFDIPFTTNNTVGMGVGLGFSHYSNRTQVVFFKNYEEKSTIIGSPVDGHKYKIGFNYLEIPVEFRFRIPYGDKDKQHFKFLIGGKIGYCIQSHTRDMVKVSGQRHVSKDIHLPDVNPLRYGVTARIGIRNWSLFGAYYFSSLFKSDKSIELYPFSMGISISLF